MQAVNIHETKTNLSALLVRVEKNGETFLICRNGKPVAELGPHHPRSRLACHPVLRDINIRYDPVEGLSDDEWGEID